MSDNITIDRDDYDSLLADRDSLKGLAVTLDHHRSMTDLMQEELSKTQESKEYYRATCADLTKKIIEKDKYLWWMGALCLVCLLGLWVALTKEPLP